MGTLTCWNPLGHCRPVMGLIYLYHIYRLQEKIHSRNMRFYCMVCKWLLGDIMQLWLLTTEPLGFSASALLTVYPLELLPGFFLEYCLNM